MAIALQSSELDRESLRHGFHIGGSLTPSRALRTKRKMGYPARGWWGWVMGIVGALHGRGAAGVSERSHAVGAESHPSKNEGWGTRLLKKWISHLLLGGAAVFLFCSMTFFTVVITTSFTLPRERSECGSVKRPPGADENGVANDGGTRSTGGVCHTGSTGTRKSEGDRYPCPAPLHGRALDPTKL